MLKTLIISALLLIPFLLLSQVNGEYNDLALAKKNPLDVRILDLSKQKLKEFPVEIFSFENLEELDLSKNRIEWIPTGVVKLSHLRILNMSRNILTRIPAEVGQLVNLEKLILNQNEIVGLCPEISNLKKLKLLDLWGNLLDELPESISQLKSSLEVLDMRVIYMSAEKQQAIIELLPYTQIYFSYSCNCKN